MDFALCSSCNHWPRLAVDRRRYYVSSCGKLFCANCLNRQEGKCVCPGGTCKIVEVNNEASPEVKALFADPMPLLQECFNGMKRAMKIMEFQNAMRSQTVQISKKMYDALRAQSSELEIMKTHNMELKKQTEKLERENEQMRRLLNESKVHPYPVPVAITTPPARDTPNDSLNLFPAPPTPTPRANAVVQPQPFFVAESPSPPLFSTGNRSLLTPSPAFSSRSSHRFPGNRVTFQNEVNGSNNATTPRYCSGPLPSPSPSPTMSTLSTRTGSTLSPLTPSYTGRVRTTTPLRSGVADRLRSLRCSGFSPASR